MDIALILDSAEIMAPALRDTARRFLEAEARHLGVQLDPGSVVARRAEGLPDLHITGAAEELLAHLVAAEPDPLSDEGGLMALARIGAQPIMTRAELGRPADSPPITRAADPMQTPISHPG